MHIVVDKHQIGSVGEQADQKAADIVLVVSNPFGPGAEDGVELEQYEDQHENAGYDREADIAKTTCQTRCISVPRAIVIYELEIFINFSNSRIFPLVKNFLKMFTEHCSAQNV